MTNIKRPIDQLTHTHYSEMMAMQAMASNLTEQAYMVEAVHHMLDTIERRKADLAQRIGTLVPQPITPPPLPPQQQAQQQRPQYHPQHQGHPQSEEQAFVHRVGAMAHHPDAFDEYTSPEYESEIGRILRNLDRHKNAAE